MSRPDRRLASELRPVRIQRRVLRGVPGSVIIETGHTRVLCTASVTDEVPAWRAGRGTGWLTAEYDMLPASTGQRRERNRGGRLDGRTQEIQRLVGRCLRAVVDLDALGERTIWIDCDVLQADGGTRTAAITGAYVAFRDAVDWARQNLRLSGDPVCGQVAGVSVGIVEGQPRLDLCYEEDSAADVDLNVAMLDDGRFVEVQGTAERRAFTSRELDRMVRMAASGIRQLHAIQRRALSSGRTLRGRRRRR